MEEYAGVWLRMVWREPFPSEQNAVDSASKTKSSEVGNTTHSRLQAADYLTNRTVCVSMVNLHGRYRLRPCALP